MKPAPLQSVPTERREMAPALFTRCERGMGTFSPTRRRFSLGPRTYGATRLPWHLRLGSDCAEITGYTDWGVHYRTDESFYKASPPFRLESPSCPGNSSLQAREGKSNRNIWAKYGGYGLMQNAQCGICEGRFDSGRRQTLCQGESTKRPGGCRQTRQQPI